MFMASYYGHKLLMLMGQVSTYPMALVVVTADPQHVTSSTVLHRFQLLVYIWDICPTCRDIN